MSRSAQAKSNAKGAWRHADRTVAMRPRTPRTPRGGRATFALNSFSVGELVLCKNVNRPQSLWPAIVVEPSRDAPESVRRIAQAAKLCVMFYGPAANKIRPRDFCWASEGDVVPLTEYLDELRDTARANGGRGDAFQEAVHEVLLVEQGRVDPLRGTANARPQQQTSCNSCGKRLDEWEASNAAAYGGHCAGCNQLHKEGSYCPVCSKVWFPTDRNMAGCDNCSFWVHDHCDEAAGTAIEFGDAVTYYCPQCRRQANAHHKLQNLRQAEAQLRAAQPSRPRSAYNLFSQELTKSYRLEAGSIGPEEMGRVVGTTWKAMSSQEKAPYERVATDELERYMDAKRTFEALHRHYSTLHYGAQESGYLDEHGTPRDFATRPNGGTAALLSLTQVQRAMAKIGSMEKQKQAAPARSSAPKRPRPRSPSPELDISDDDEPEEEPDSPPKKKRPVTSHARAAPAAQPAQGSLPAAPGGRLIDTGTIIQRVPVFCNGLHGVYLLGRQRIVCSCPDCLAKPEAKREHSCTQFEMHCGAGAAKKWKASLRVEPGGVPEVPAGGASMPIGKWLRLKGYELKPNQNRAPPGSSAAYKQKAHVREEPSPPPLPPREPKPPKEDKGPPPPFEPWFAIRKGEYKPIKVRWAGDRCSVCDSDVDFDSDQLVSCDMCGITVHQSCYGVPELPGVDDMWLCRACELKEQDKVAPQCCLCPVSGGALKPAEGDDLWCHAACMQWIPEVSVKDVARMEPVCHIKSIQKERWDLMCCICKQRVGAKIQCTSCYTAYHPLCARLAGLHMEILDGGDSGEEVPVRLISYCPKHCTAHPELAGVQLVKEGEEEDRGDDGNGLWNCQPFKQPLSVPVPICPSGSSRAQPLQNWERISHGTGMGYSTVTGFWIPDKPPPPPPPKEAPAKAALKGASSAKLKTHPAFASKGAKRISGKPSSSRKHDSGDHKPPQVATLTPLPEGVPEQLHVACAGRLAVLTVRSQTVTFGGQTMSASRFEAVCGKGDAKKWKSSLWAASPEGIPLQVMSEWLTEKKLDRKLLGTLAANLAAAEAWEDFQSDEVLDVLEELVADVAGEPREAPAPLQLLEAPDEEVSVKEEEGSTAEVLQEAPQAEDSAMPEAGSSAPALPDGAARLPEALEASGAAAAAGNAPAAAPAARLEAAEEQKPEVQLLEYTPAVKAEPMEVDQSATFDTTALNGTSSPAEGTSISPYGTRRKEQRVAEAAAKAAAAAARAEEAAAAAATGIAEAVAVSVAAPEAQAGSPAAQPEQDPVRLKPKANQRQRPTAQPPAKQPGLEELLLERIFGSQEAASSRPKSGPEARVGQRCRVWYEADDDWYEAVIRGYDRHTRLHNLWYPYDEEDEWLDAAEEARRGRLRWLASDDGVTPSAADARPPADPEEEQLPGPRKPPPQGHAAVGCTIGVWWIDDAQYYFGRVQEYDAETTKHLVLYEDGDKEWLNLTAERVEWEQEEQPESTEPEAHAPRPVPAKDIPSHLRVCCGAMRGNFDVQRALVILDGGREISPTEFERMAGKAASKKWKASVRIDKGGGTPGMTMGDWLVEKGLDAPRTNKPKAASSLTVLRQRQVQQARAGHAALQGQPQQHVGRQGHREGCMCVICKQARRSGRQWGGMTDACWLPAAALPGARREGPPLRCGKRAFVRAVAQRPGGTQRSELWVLPEVRALTGAELEASSLEELEEDAEEAQADAAAADKAEEVRAGAAPEAEGEQQIGTAAKRKRKGPSVKERLMRCQRTERERLTFGKSGIHGWGLFARKKLKQDSMVIEYRGDLLRRTAADAREKAYQAAGKDCYLFTVNEDCVIDATMTGGIGRFTNHCCAPSMYTKVLDIDGRPRLVFFARFDLRPGQELTYDYRFKEEEGENKLPCGCGAPNCRGTLN